MTKRRSVAMWKMPAAKQSIRNAAQPKLIIREAIALRSIITMVRAVRTSSCWASIPKSPAVSVVRVRHALASATMVRFHRKVRF
jgi:hypothetical protein